MSASLKKQKSVRISKLDKGKSSGKLLTAEESQALAKARKQEKAALSIQLMYRRKVARDKVRRVVEGVWERVFDPKVRLYFWYNKSTGESKWQTPFLLQLYRPEDHSAAVQIERIARGFLGRVAARRKAALKYTRFYEAKKNKFYYMINATQKTFWKASPWLVRMQIPLPAEDQMLYESQQKIKELEALLRAKDEEIMKVRQKRFEELEPEVIKDKLMNARAVPKSKHMDEWTVDDLAQWFGELRFDEYIPKIYAHKIDGLLFINLTNEDWPDMGIVNKFHCKKLALILKSYRARYQRRLEKKKDLDDDDDISDYAPSELSDLLAQESGSETEQEEAEDENNRELSSTSSSEEEEVDQAITEEERIERMLDKKNMKIEVKARGDGENYPMVGDIVRVRYTCTLIDGKLVSSTKHSMGRDSIEFVLGVDQVIKAFDRALVQMSIGERALITSTPEYGYGKEGLYAMIPPESHLIFDITLLGFRPREIWIKPLIQEPGFSEKPYIDVNAGNAFNRGGVDDGGSVASGSLAQSASIGSASISRNSMLDALPGSVLSKKS